MFGSAFRRMGVRALGLATLFSTSIASGAIVSFDLNHEFSGATPPAGTAPWLRVTFNDGGGSGSVVMTMTALSLTGSEFVTEWDINLDPTLDPTSLSFSAPTKVGTFADPVISKGVNAFKADGDGRYDVEVKFDNAPPGNRFGAGDSATFTITGIPTLTAASFNFLSAPDGGHGPFTTAGHVQGIGSGGNDSGWIAPIVPEPSVIGLAGFTALTMLRRRSDLSRSAQE